MARPEEERDSWFLRHGRLFRPFAQSRAYLSGNHIKSQVQHQRDRNPKMIIR